MSRPTKNEALAIAKRDKVICNMDKKGYPVDYISSFFGITKGRVSQIIKKSKKHAKKRSNKRQ